jgi:hypothetical protein
MGVERGQGHYKGRDLEGPRPDAHGAGPVGVYLPGHCLLVGAVFPQGGSKRGRAGKRDSCFSDPSLEEKSMSQSSHLPDQPIMKYVHPTDRLRPWFGVAVGLAASESPF